jgi:hypothetical protein
MTMTIPNTPAMHEVHRVADHEVLVVGHPQRPRWAKQDLNTGAASIVG